MKIYLIGDGEGLFKIGRSSDTGVRLKSVQTGNGRDLELLYEVDVEYPSKVEAIMHKRHATKRMKGEWFSLNQEDRERFVQEVKEIDANLVYVADNSSLDNPLML